MFKLKCGKFMNLEKMIYTIIKRFKNGKEHWAEKRKKNKHTDRAMEHFDDFYGAAFGDQWKGIKNAIIRRHKYVAVVNNYGEESKTIDFLQNLGAFNLRKTFEERKKLWPRGEETVFDNDPIVERDSIIKSYTQQLSRDEISQMYNTGKDVQLPTTLQTEQTTITTEDNKQKLQFEEEMDSSRIIEPELGMAAASLWTFVPATKIKGREDWLPESHHYQYYSSADDFPLTIEDDDDFVFPANLQIYMFPKHEHNNFPEPKLQNIGVYDYYLMDASSILPVVALGVCPGDCVLDMCASPGGKSLAILQTMLTEFLVLNDISLSRLNRIKKVLKEYLYDYEISNKWHERLLLTQEDGTRIRDEGGFHKVLVDVPCTTDRLSLRENDNNIFKPGRIKERLRIPEIQASLLCNALNLCKVGGTVVYSTCSLSPIQNDGVVHMGLKKAFENHGIKATIKLFNKSIMPLRGIYHLGEGSTAAKYGHLVVPNIPANYGPGYFCKLVRTK